MAIDSIGNGVYNKFGRKFKYIIWAIRTFCIMIMFVDPVCRLSSMNVFSIFCFI